MAEIRFVAWRRTSHNAQVLIVVDDLVADLLRSSDQPDGLACYYDWGKPNEATNRLAFDLIQAAVENTWAAHVLYLDYSDQVLRYKTAVGWVIEAVDVARWVVQQLCARDCRLNGPRAAEVTP